MSLLLRYLVTAMPSSSDRNLVTVMSLEERNLETTLSKNLVTEISFSSRNEVKLFAEVLEPSKNLVTVTSLEVARFFVGGATGPQILMSVAFLQQGSL